jgi:SAM-dependent methyltransferase
VRSIAGLVYHGAVEHWARIARHWALLGPPLRPSPEDVAITAREATRATRALVLGVTPELAALPVRSLVAIDHTRAMIGAIFPPAPNRAAIVGDWRALPLPSRSIDLIAGDGALACLPFPDGTRALAAELARVLAPGGRVVLRLFASPPAPESLDEIRIASDRGFHAFKWRVAMALAAPDRNVRVSDIHRAFETICPDRAALPWPRAVIDTIDAYRDSPASYAFPTVDETRAALAPLVDVACHVPSYELGDRCPTLVLRVR